MATAFSFTQKWLNLLKIPQHSWSEIISAPEQQIQTNQVGQELAESIETMLLKSAGQKNARVRFAHVARENRFPGNKSKIFPVIVIVINLPDSPDISGLQRAVDEIATRFVLPNGFLIRFNVYNSTVEE